MLRNCDTEAISDDAIENIFMVCWYVSIKEVIYV